MEYKKILSTLTNNDVRYLVVGAVGLVLSGYNRNTADLDLLVDLETDNLRKVIQFMNGNSYKPRPPVPATDILDSEKRRSWTEEKNLKAFTFFDSKNPFGNIDLLIYSNIDFKGAWERKQTFYVNETPIYVASLEDLEVLKANAVKNRALPKDFQDLEAITELKRRRENDNR